MARRRLSNLTGGYSLFLFFRQRAEQNFTSSQTFAHFFRHANGRPHRAQIFSGRLGFVYFPRFGKLSSGMLTEQQFPYINQQFDAAQVAPRQMDLLWNAGWRHFGTQFFRYNLGFYEFEIRRVIPLRIRLADFKFSKSQRRVLNRNQDLETVIRPTEIDAEREELFNRHKRRFKSGVPDSIYDFLSEIEPARVPCPSLEVDVFENGRLIAASFFDVGREAVSGVYGMFEPTETVRGLGIFTMLLEIRYALENGKIFYHLGYAYEGNSFYDYKKRFSGLESYDWNEGVWRKFEEEN
jgi:leucyl-tRNA---protein transferase